MAKREGGFKKYAQGNELYIKTLVRGGERGNFSATIIAVALLLHIHLTRYIPVSFFDVKNGKNLFEMRGKQKMGEIGLKWVD